MISISKVKRLRQQGRWDAKARKALRPYAVTLGELVFAWNRLHHNLAILFDLTVKSPSPELSLAVWYSTDNDASQRKMLQVAAAKAAQFTKDQRADIGWVLSQIDDSLRHKRNNSTHAPLAFQ